MEPIIKVDNVSMCFNLSTEKHESLKEGSSGIRQRGAGTVPAMGPGSGRTENFWMNLQKRI